MIKLAVGISQLSELPDAQKKWMTTYHGQKAFPVYTRRKPKRADEIIKTGGSLYRVIKSRIQCRQQILGIELIEDDDQHDGSYCLIFCDPEIIQTISKPHRPFQGWRYFTPEKAPRDRGVFQEDGSPPDPKLEMELKELGLI
ncbi:MAG: DUF1489 domain-containing protein [Pseudomonadota bacterium]